MTASKKPLYRAPKVYRSLGDDTSRRRAFVLGDLVYPHTVSHFDLLLGRQHAERAKRPQKTVVPARA